MIYVLYSLHGKGITMTSKRCLFTLLFTCFCFNLLKREIILKKGSVTMDNKKRKRPLVLCFILPISLPALRFLFTLSLTPLRQKEASAKERAHNLILFYFSIQSTHYYENLCEKDLNTERFFTRMVLKRPDFFC